MRYGPSYSVALGDGLGGCGVLELDEPKASGLIRDLILHDGRVDDFPVGGEVGEHALLRRLPTHSSHEELCKGWKVLDTVNHKTRRCHKKGKFPTGKQGETDTGAHKRPGNKNPVRGRGGKGRGWYRACISAGIIIRFVWFIDVLGRGGLRLSLLLQRSG